MGWDIISFQFDSGRGATRVFNYELAISEGNAELEPEVVQGDGVLLNTGQVYFNRQDKLKAAASRAGMSPEAIVSTFASWVVSHRMQTRP